MSSPYDGTSVNASIDRSSTRLYNVTLTQAARVILALGAGTLCFKFDAVSAYKLVRLLHQDWHLHGELDSAGETAMFSFSMTSTFGASSSADTWHDPASGAEFILRLCVTNMDALCRYSDDFLALISPVREGTPDILRASNARQQIIDVCGALGFPIAKFEGPTQSLTFIGTGIDTSSMSLFLPAEQLNLALLQLTAWLHRKTAKISDFRSLAGTLEWLCRIVLWGRPHLGYVLALIKHTNNNHFVKINAEFRRDIAWWLEALRARSSISMQAYAPFVPTTRVETDASSFGFGAWWPATGQFLHGLFTPEEIKSAQRLKSRSTGELELRAIAIAVTTWGQAWTGQAVLILTDNQSALQAIVKRKCRVPNMRAILRHIAFVSHLYTINFHAEYINTEDNIKADLLSRDKVDAFVATTQSAASSATTPLPVPLRN
jgi:hypothetical protein